MKLKRFVAIVLTIALMAMCFVSCRTKNEVAYTFTYMGQKVDITTALYMCFMLDADMEFETKATELADEAKTKYESYKELKYEDKDYATWVKDKVKQDCAEYAFYQVMFDKMGLEGDINGAFISGGDGNYYTAEQFYEAYKDTYSINGVALTTYKEYMYNTQYKAPMVYYFYIEEADEVDHSQEGHTHEDGSTHPAEETTAKPLDKEIEALRGSMVPKDKDIKKAFVDNVVPVYQISFSLTTDSGEAVSADTKKNFKSLLEGYESDLANGADIKDVYKQYLVDSGQATSLSEAQVNGEYETLLFSKEYNEVSTNTAEETENFSAIKKLGVGETKIVESDEAFTLYVRRDALKDKDANGEKYSTANEGNIIFFLTYDNFTESTVKEATEKMEVEENASAIDYYTVEKIQQTTTLPIETTTSPYLYE